MGYPYVKIVGPSGGTIAPGDGLEIIIPAGMFPGDAKIVVEAPVDVESQPAGRTTAGKAYKIRKEAGADPNLNYMFTIKLPFFTRMERYRAQLNCWRNVKIDDPGTWLQAPIRVDDGVQYRIGGQHQAERLFGFHCVFKG